MIMASYNDRGVATVRVLARPRDVRRQMLANAHERLAKIGIRAPVMEAATLMLHIDFVVVYGSAGRMVGVVTKTDIAG